MLSVLRNWLVCRLSRSHRSVAGFRPQVEMLEGRDVPSTLQVTNLSDNAFMKGSLRYDLAHTSAAGNDTIDFKVTGQINLQSELLISNGVTIKGPGGGRLTLTTNYNFGDPFGQSIRAIEVNASKPVVISGLTIADNGVDTEGGAILNHTTLTINGCDFVNNFAGYGGAIANHGTLTSVACEFSSNIATNDGGSIYNVGTMSIAGGVFSSSSTSFQQSADFGGAIYNAGTMTVSNCTFSDNAAVLAGGTIYNTGTLTVKNSHFTGSIPDDIFGPYIDGGGNTFG